MDSTILDQVILHLYNIVPGKVTHAQILKNCYRNDASVPLAGILIHVVKDGFVDRWPFADDGRSDIEKDSFSLSVTGIRKHQNASFKRQGLYQTKEIEEAIQKEIDDRIKINQRDNSNSQRVVKKYWWLLIIVGWVGGMATDMGKEYLKRRLFPEVKPKETNSTKTDSLSTKPDSVKRR